MPLECDDFVFKKVNWPLPLRRGGFRLTAKSLLSVTKPNCPRSLSWVFLGKNLKKLLSYSKSKPLNLSNCKILLKTILCKFETKHGLFEYFWTIFFIKLLLYLKATPSNLPFSKIREKTIMAKIMAK